MFTPIPRVQVPATATKGELFPVKTLISHPMEPGLRRDDRGNVIPRKIINTFTCRYNDDVVFSVELHEGMAASPYIEFHLRATESGRLTFSWGEDGGSFYGLEHHLTVGE
jgi:sulfur-oxidizing protein SoxZ